MNKLRLRTRTLRFVFCAALIGASLHVWAEGFASLAGAAPPANRAQSSAAILGPHIPPVVYEVAPNEADPDLKRFLKPDYALFIPGLTLRRELLVFFPGTGGEPKGSWPFLETGANSRYRVIGLMYDNGVSVPNICGPQPDPACSDRFREKRIFGDGVSSDIDDLPGESVVNRLTKLLQYLAAQHPQDGWGDYLANGQPNWARIVVSGHSQGGGIAAYIAKKEKVARVVVLSGAWDRVEATKQWAPWVTTPSATPLDRWYAAYHQKESRADAMKAAYVVLKIPPANIRVFTLEPNPANKIPAGSDAYHVSMSVTGVTPLDANGQPAYAPDWAFMLGAKQ
jgi:dienelactone hydrolase